MFLRKSEMELNMWNLVLIELCILLSLCHWSRGDIAVDDTILEPKVLMQARCQAHCYAQYGNVMTRSPGNGDDASYSSKACMDEDCLECLVPCGKVHQSHGRCQKSCNESGECLESCEFLQTMKKTSSRPGTTTGTGNVSTTINQHVVIRNPQVICQQLTHLKTKKAKAMLSTVRLIWDLVPGQHVPGQRVSGQRVFGQHVTSDIVFVISSRHLKKSNGEASAWKHQKTVNNPFAVISGLRCSTMYQFRVTAVSPDGLVHQMATTSWAKTLTASNNYSASSPVNVTLEEQLVIDQKPAAQISWEPGQDSWCFYQIYFLGKTLLSDEFPVSRKFSFLRRDLTFSTDYTVHLSKYDDELGVAVSHEVTLKFRTPGCLEGTSYNYTVCAPLVPNNLTLEILTPNWETESVEYVNISLHWIPPNHTHADTDILRYHVEYRKEPYYNEAIALLPHSSKQYVKPPLRSATFIGLHNHNRYAFTVWAETVGGIGNKTRLLDYIAYNATQAKDGLQSLESGLPNDSDAGTSHVEMLAIVLVPVVMVLAIIVLVGCVIIRKRRKPYCSPTRFGPVEEMNPIYERVSRDDRMEYTAEFKSDKYEIDYSSLDFITVVGEGAFGKVVKAEYFPTPLDREKRAGNVVAVKMLKDYYTGDESRNFLLEIQAMKNLGHHPHVVSIIGSCVTGPKLCLVMDYCALGDLRNYLRKFREQIMYSTTTQDDVQSHFGLKPNCGLNHTSHSSLASGKDGCSDISEAQLMSYARQITMGMEFLEQRKFIHRDLAARNVLLFDQRHLKISDFGLTRDVYETNMYQPTSARKLPYKWMAIESLFSQRFTIKSDVWSFGIVMWEIVTLGGSPYPSIPIKDLYSLLNNGYRMEKPENCTDQIYQIMLSCWHPNPNVRPSFTQLRNEIEKLLEDTQLYIDLSVDVCEDYFNDSTAEVSGTPSAEPTVPNLEVERQDVQQNEYVIGKDLYVDIHSEPADECVDATDTDSVDIQDENADLCERDKRSFVDSKGTAEPCRAQRQNGIIPEVGRTGNKLDKSEFCPSCLLRHSNKKCCSHRVDLLKQDMNENTSLFRASSLRMPESKLCRGFSSPASNRAKLGQKDCLRQFIEKVELAKGLLPQQTRKRSNSLTGSWIGSTKCNTYL